MERANRYERLKKLISDTQNTKFDRREKEHFDFLLKEFLKAGYICHLIKRDGNDVFTWRISEWKDIKENKDDIRFINRRRNTRTRHIGKYWKNIMILLLKMPEFRNWKILSFKLDSEN